MTTQLEPGQIVQHPEHGNGIIAISFTRRTIVQHVEPNGDAKFTYDLTGWEPIDVVKPGHVQVRVDDLDLRGWDDDENIDVWNDGLRAAVRVAKAKAAPTESHKESASSETVTENDASNLTTTVSLPCPDCGETITREAKVWSHLDSGRILAWATSRPDADWHTCAPVEPVRLMHPEPTERVAKATFTFHDGTVVKFLRISDSRGNVWQHENGLLWTWERLTDEDGDDRAGSLVIGWGDEPEQFTEPEEPQEFGARVTVTTPDGRVEKWLRSEPDTDEAWRANVGSAIGYFSATTWNEVCERGAVTYGWGDQ